MAFSNPLRWPAGQVRTPRRRKAPFNAGETTILRHMLGVTHPDAGGSEAALEEVRRAYQEWKQA